MRTFYENGQIVDSNARARENKVRRAAETRYHCERVHSAPARAGTRAGAREERTVTDGRTSAISSRGVLGVYPSSRATPLPTHRHRGERETCGAGGGEADRRQTRARGIARHRAGDPDLRGLQRDVAGAHAAPAQALDLCEL